MRIVSLQKYFFFLILAITSCRESSTIQRPDVSDIAVEVKIERFDQELGNLQPGDILNKNRKWQQQYGEFYTDFMVQMLKIGSPKDSVNVQKQLQYILQQKEFNDLSAAVQKKYPSMSQYEKEISQALRYIKYYFPEYKIPRFITYFSGFEYQTPIGEDYVGIGLDMFLGADSEFYPALIHSIPLYISRRFAPEYITPRVIEVILREDLCPMGEEVQNILQHMIYNGKILYAMDVLLEDVSDEIKIGYTSEQMAWVRKYQSDIWSWFIQENLLYSTDWNRIQKYFSEAPFTPELGERNESAPKLGSYMGWMIVRRYMEKHPQETLKTLFAKTDAQQIMEASKFKGK